MTKTENLSGEPIIDGAAKLVELAREEMIHSLDDSKMIVAGESGYQRFDFFDVTMFVISSMHKKFWLVALAQK